MNSVLDIIGNTPMIELRQICSGKGAGIFAKCEFMNPSGSLKDRMAKYIIQKAEERGELKPGSTILEVSSGNTGIAFAMIGAAKGYRVVIMLPKTVSVERRKIITSLGAELILIDDLLSMQDAIKEAEEMAERDAMIFLPRQFSNPDNPAAQYSSLGREILSQIRNRVDAFVMGVGTGGTLMGAGRALKEAFPEIKIVAVEPAESAMLSGETPGPHGIQGLVDGFIPEIVDLEFIDEIIKVKTDEAIKMSHRLAKEEGLLVGISAGANVLASLDLAGGSEKVETIVTILPDTGTRYLSLS
ncbi:MAG: cysteine synthase A [Desulfuromonadales bacterium C00003093]|nr:MAG: cysteine synthase A [Desulfuromonadales bacterium C00003093]